MQTVYPELVATFTDSNTAIFPDVIDLTPENEVIHDENQVMDLTSETDDSSRDKHDVIDLTGEDDDYYTRYPSSSSSKRYTVVGMASNVLEFFTDSEGEY